MHRTTSSQTRLVLNGVDDDEELTPELPRASSSKTTTTTTPANTNTNTKYSAEVTHPSQATRSKFNSTSTTPGYRLILPTEEMETNDTATTIINSLVNPATVPIRTSSRSSSTARDKKKKRAYPTAAFGG